MLGGAIGLIIGFIGFLTLKGFVVAAMDGKKSFALFAVIQPLVLISGLICCAFLLPSQLHWAGISMAAALMFAAVFNTVQHIRKDNVPSMGKDDRENEANS